MIAEALSRMIPLRATKAPDDDFWYHPAGSVSSAGVTVNADTAMGVAACYACISVLAKTLASLPFRVYRQTGKEKEQVPDHEFWKLLHDRPNVWQTSYEWREMGMAHILTRGNFYCLIADTKFGTQLIPLRPERMQVEQMPDFRIRYKYTPPDGPERMIQSNQILHIRGLSRDGITGVGIIENARNALGLSIAQETHGSGQFKNGGLPAFYIKRPEGKRWDTTAITNFRAAWRKIHAGPENAGNPPILEDGMSLESLGMTNEDTQWIESRGFQAIEICRFFGVPPHMIAILDRATFSNIEEQGIDFGRYTLAPWCVRWEQCIGRDLIIDEPDIFCKLVIEGLQRGNIQSRYAAYNVGLQAGFLTRNEVREWEDLNPIDGGDTPLEPLNQVPAGSRDQGQREEAPASDRQEREPPDQRGAFAVLIEDAAARIGAAEIRGLEARADKAAGDRERWGQWAGAFYLRHRDYVIRTLTPLCAAWNHGNERKVSADPMADSICALGLAVLEADVPAVLSAWQHTRAGELAELLKGEFFRETL